MIALLTTHDRVTMGLLALAFLVFLLIANYAWPDRNR